MTNNRHTPYTLAAALVRWRLSHLHLRFPATWQRHDAQRLKELEYAKRIQPTGYVLELGQLEKVSR